MMKMMMMMMVYTDEELDFGIGSLKLELDFQFLQVSFSDNKFFQSKSLKSFSQMFVIIYVYYIILEWF